MEQGQDLKDKVKHQAAVETWKQDKPGASKSPVLCRAAVPLTGRNARGRSAQRAQEVPLCILPSVLCQAEPLLLAEGPVEPARATIHRDTPQITFEYLVQDPHPFSLVIPLETPSWCLI